MRALAGAAEVGAAQNGRRERGRAVLAFGLPLTLMRFDGVGLRNRLDERRRATLPAIPRGSALPAAALEPSVVAIGRGTLIGAGAVLCLLAAWASGATWYLVSRDEIVARSRRRSSPRCSTPTRTGSARLRTHLDRGRQPETSGAGRARRPPFRSDDAAGPARNAAGRADHARRSGPERRLRSPPARAGIEDRLFASRRGTRLRAGRRNPPRPRNAWSAPARGRRQTPSPHAHSAAHERIKSSKGRTPPIERAPRRHRPLDEALSRRAQLRTLDGFVRAAQARSRRGSGPRSSKPASTPAGCLRARRPPSRWAALW